MWSMLSPRFLPSVLANSPRREKGPPSACCSPLSCAARPHHTQTNLILNPAVSFVVSTPPLPSDPTEKPHSPSWCRLLGHRPTRVLPVCPPCSPPAHASCLDLGSRTGTALAFFGGQTLRH